MEERLLKFARIVEAGSFTKAATAMHISQPALTAAVKKLEKELGAELLIRGSRSLELTAAGRIAYTTAKTLATETQNLETRIHEAEAHKTTLHLGMIDSLAHLLFVKASYLEQLERETQVSLTIDNTARLIEQISHNELDIALTTEPARLPAALIAEVVGQEPLIMVAPQSLVPGLQAEMGRGTITHFLSYNQTSGTHQIITRHFTQHGLSLQPAFYSTSPEIMLQLVIAGYGAAVLPYLLVKPYLADGTLHPLPVGPGPIIRRTIMSVRRSGRVLSGQAQVLLEHTAKELQTLNKEAGNL